MAFTLVHQCWVSENVIFFMGAKLLAILVECGPIVGPFFSVNHSLLSLGCDTVFLSSVLWTTISSAVHFRALCSRSFQVGNFTFLSRRKIRKTR